MPAGFDLQALLGLRLDAAEARLRAAGAPEPLLIRSHPARSRHELPALVVWRVARVRWQADVPELVLVASMPLPDGTLPADGG